MDECDVFQKVKTENIHTPGLLQPLPILDQAWQDISMDFVEGLPKVGNKNAMLEVVGKLTKYDHLLALKHPFSMADLFLNEIYILHGLPRDQINSIRYGSYFH